MSVALIVAGGKGLRMNMDVRKQYLDLHGRPLLLHTLRVFDHCCDIDSIVLVVPPQDMDYCRKSLMESSGLSKAVVITGGGDERQQSVYNGLCAMNVSPEKIVVIHDGVRPFVGNDMISECINAARHSGASILAVPVSDTIKMDSGDGTIKKTVDRSLLWAAQTPQAFRYDWIRDAHEKALADGFCATDDASLVERLGYPVKLVMGSRKNIKITTPEDLAIALALMDITG